MSTAFTTPYNYDPNVTRAAITGEAHVVPSVAPYEIHLLHIPRQESPSSVAITGYTEVTSAPAQGQFQVIYVDASGNPTDRVVFNAADAGKPVSASYHACGTLVYAQEIVSGDNRTNVKQMQNAINSTETTLSWVEDRVVSVMDPKYGAKGDGALDQPATGTDDSAAINAALADASSGMIVDGGGKTYRVMSVLTVPAGVTFRNAVLQLATDAMNGVDVNTGSRVVDVHINGTGAVNLYPSASVGVTSATGVTDVVLDVEVSKVTQGVTAPSNTLRWQINVYAHNIVGQAGVSEGYGALLSGSGCGHHKVNLRAVTVQRHALYISAGTSYCDAYVDVDGCSDIAVQIATYSNQTDTAYNTVRGKVRNAVQGGEIFGAFQTSGSATNKYNTFVLDVEADGTTTQSAVNVFGPYGGPYPVGNTIRGGHMTGHFLGAAAIVLAQSAEGTLIEGNAIDAYTDSADGCIALKKTGGTDTLTQAGVVRNNRIDGQGQNVIGVSIGIDTSSTYVGENDIRNNGASLRVSDGSNGKRRGHCRESEGAHTFSAVAGTGSANIAIAFPENLENAVVTVAITAQSVSNVASTTTADAVTSSGFTLYVYNANATAQNITVSWRATGD